MNLTGIAVRQWQLTLIIAGLLAALGISAFLTIPRSVDPHFPIPIVIIVAAQPGADAADMEETVAKPIEERVQGLDDINSIESSSNDGLSIVTIEFDWGSDADEKFNDAVREVGAVRDSLPPGTALEYRRARTTRAALVQYALVSETASWRRMEKYADDLSEQLTRVQGIRESEAFGMPDLEVRVAIDPARLAQYRVPAGAVAQALSRAGADLPAGVVHAGDTRFNVEAGGAFRTLEEVRTTPLRAGGGTVLTVGDVAEVSWSTDERLHIVRVNGKRAVVVAAQQKDGLNALAIREDVEVQMSRFAASLPPDIELVNVFDQTIEIRERLGVLARDFAIALGLVLITLLPLGPRASVIVMVSIPLSLASGVLMMQLTGYSLNQLSIAGFILSLGLLVDDSIVVTENISRHLRMGASRLKAALDGTKEIQAAVLGSTGVLIFAFLPIASLPGGAGLFTRSLPLAVIYTVSASLIVSLTIIPFLASRILRRDDDPEGNIFMRALQRGIHKVYTPILHRALARPRRWFAGTMALCLSALALVPVLGFTLFPNADVPFFTVEVRTPEGTGVEGTDRVVRRLGDRIGEEPGIRYVIEHSGAGGPQVFYNVFSDFERTREGIIVAVMDEWDPRRGPELLDRLRADFDDDPEAEILVRRFANGAPVAAPLAVRVTGPDLQEIRRISGEVATLFRTHAGTRDVENPLSENRIDLNLGLDRDKAAILGVAPEAVRETVRLSLLGQRGGTFRDEEGDSYPVTVRLPMGERRQAEALRDIYVPTTSGDIVPLGQLADPFLESVPPRIDRYQLERVNVVTSFVREGFLASKVLADLEPELAAIDLPPAYAIGFGGEAEATAESFAGLGLIAMLAVAGVFAVLVAEFGRFRETIVVAGVIPLGFFGGLIALWITGNSISYTGVIGFIALIGIEIKNSILLVDFTSKLRARGMGLREAVEEAAEIRFLPVLLTSVTAIGGLMPLALGGTALYAPLSIVIIGGLISSTLLSRIVTPVMYLLIARRNAADEDGNSASGSLETAS
ncbi:multidrug transporter AcrB [Pacificimonas flava]|uniref:Multidrug transporter AcrB n=2 Tax=Pacificimonas TaxID=1960290 RepID=A0A219B8L9_9SPHN|nr:MULTISPECIES: efflux RND transporter permease subunit [Pacificimonas]MBZ6379955.1 efflux RND transporter permease subunit [Pacificimonas aurantium]OWV34476.1 multidrug transporter AcrB [Pacificimonas flava]